MRVHPELLTPRATHWQYPAIATLLILVLVASLARAPLSVDKKHLQPVRRTPSLPVHPVSESTVAVPVFFGEGAPIESSRIAVTMRPTGDANSLLLVDDAWVVRSHDRATVLRVKPQQALLLQSVQSRGVFSFIELPRHGTSPYAGKAVESIPELEPVVPKSSPVSKTDVQKSSRGYVWVPDQGARYGISEQGEVKITISP